MSIAAGNGTSRVVPMTKPVAMVTAISALIAASVCWAAGHPQSAPQVTNAPSARSIEALMAEGEQSLGAGRYEEAAAQFRLVLARRSDVPEALFGLGIASSQLGRLEEAREALEHYVSLQPSAADGHCALGVVLLAEGRREGAKAQLERAMRLEPKNLEAAKALAHIATAENNGKRAVALLKPLSTSPDFDDEARRLLAAGYAQSGDDRAALSTLGPVLERNPPPPPNVFMLVIGSALRAGDKALAMHACDLGLRSYLNSDEIELRCLNVTSMSYVNSLESTLRGTAGDVPTLIVMGRLLTGIADVTDQVTRARCIKLLEKAVALSPSDGTAIYNLGRALRMTERPEEAIPVLKRALGTHPSDELQTLIWTQIGLAEQSLRQNSGAEDAFSRAFRLNQGLSRHLAESGFTFYTFLVAANKNSQAAAILAEIVRWDPNFVPARLKHARMLADAGHLPEAVAEAEFVAHNTDPENEPLLRAAHILLLQLYNRMGRPEEAERHSKWLKEAKESQAKEP
jgi:tetratricopeptide (TPR) repeat protein